MMILYMTYLESNIYYITYFTDLSYFLETLLIYETNKQYTLHYEVFTKLQ